MNKNYIDFRLQEVEAAYNGDNDLIPGAPIVTWADHVLLQAVRDLTRRVGELERQIEIVNEALTRIESTVPSAGRVGREW